MSPTAPAGRAVEFSRPAAATGRALVGLARADLRARVRRPAYALVLLAAIGLGLLAAPAANGRWVVLDAAGWRGSYDSAWTGTVTALAAAVWLLLGGFYVLRDSIERDEHSNVGEVLAATPLRRHTYLLGVFGSNLAVLASMAGVLACTALVMQLARGESRAVDPIALLLPFLLITLPVLAVVSAAAVLFGTLRPLRAGTGNLVWFVVWLVAVIAGQSAGAPLGGLGSSRVAEVVAADLAARGVDLTGVELSLGLTYLDQPQHTFAFSGLAVTGDLILERLLLILFAVGLAVLPACWFGRFDPARSRRGATPTPELASPQPTGTVFAGRPQIPVRRGRGAGRLLVGELRILVQGVSRWWWAVALLLAGAGAVVPAGIATGPMLLAAWIWPVLLWSRLGAQGREAGVDPLLAAYPGPYRRVLAAWAAGLILTAGTGLTPVVRMVIADDRPGLAAWLAGIAVIPAAALVLGTLGGTGRLFQVGWLALWFLAVNDVAALDVTGAVRVDGRPAGPAPVLVGATALGLLAVALAGTVVRQRAR